MKPYLTSLALVLASCAAAPVAAEQPCMPSEQAYSQLVEKHNEQRIGAGITDTGLVVEFWGGDDTWTTIVTRPDGTSCVVVFGQDWAFYGPEPQGEPG